MKTLITGAAGAKAHQLMKKLIPAGIVLGDYAALPAFMLKDGAMLVLPNPGTPSYVHLMLTLCLDNDINVVYALQNVEYDLLNAARQLFTEYGITVLRPGDEIQ